MTYVTPPTVTTGQVLGRAYLQILRNNDDHFLGLAEGWRPVNYGVSRTWIGSELEVVIWHGYHYLALDAKTLHYNYTVSGCSGGNATAHLYYDNVEIDTQVGNGNSNSTYSLAAKDIGIYEVKCTMTRAVYTDSPGAVTTFTPPYTTYTGAESYTAPDSISDGATSAATSFNKWRSNDLYFNACKPRQPGFVGQSRGHVGSSLDTVIWDGWIYHPYQYSRLYYGVNLADTLSGSHVVVSYNVDGTPEQVCDITVAGDSFSYHDLDSYTEGTLYHVQARLYRTNTDYNPGGSIIYLYLCPQPGHEAVGYTSMGEFTVGQYVYGSTGGQSTRLDLLSDNDAVIYDRLTASGTGRRDFAVSKTAYVRLGGTDYGYYRMTRQGDFLYYVGGGEIVWSGGSQYLTSTDETNPYLVLDLNSVTDLPHGTVYWISGVDDACKFAMEV